MGSYNTMSKKGNVFVFRMVTVWRNKGLILYLDALLFLLRRDFFYLLDYISLSRILKCSDRKKIKTEFEPITCKIFGTLGV